MNRTTLARRYAPLAIALAVQLLIIVTAPSTGPSRVAAGNAASAAVTEAGGTGAGGGTSAAEPGAAAGTGAAGTPGDIAAGTATAAGGTTAGSNTRSASSGAAAGAPPGVKAGDVTHCVAGRGFDPAIAYWAPPCVPGTPGGPYANNGGATATGVTGDTITIVDYVSNYGAEVNAILQAEGQLVTYTDSKPFDAAMEKFINEHYIFYGRKLKIITYAGQCTSVPPDYNCLLPEMDRLVDQYHPYVVFWNTTLCSACYAELARKKTIAVGGDGFSDEFAIANAPYFYSGAQSSSRVERAFGEWWCSQMSSVNVPTRKVKYAEPTNPAQNFNGQARRLGVISTNDPDNKNTVLNVLSKALAKCGDKIWHTYFYDQNINTAAQQVAAAIAAMDTPQNPANVVLCLCDPVAPAFLYQGEQDNNYYPENVIASDQTMDFDTTGQSYGQGDNGSPSLGCPSPPRGCEYDAAFGLSTESPNESQTNDAGLRIFHAGGGTKDLPGAIAPIQATFLARYWGMMASLIQNAGPNLTPANMQARAPSLPAVGGGSTGQSLLAFGPNNYFWIQDVRIVYWDKHKASSYNNKPGSYVQIQGDRLNLGQYKSLPNGPEMPFPRS
jgi:hypothetical protein